MVQRNYQTRLSGKKGLLEIKLPRLWWGWGGGGGARQREEQNGRKASRFSMTVHRVGTELIQAVHIDWELGALA